MSEGMRAEMAEWLLIGAVAEMGRLHLRNLGKTGPGPGRLEEAPAAPLLKAHLMTTLRASNRELQEMVARVVDKAIEEGWLPASTTVWHPAGNG